MHTRPRKMILNTSLASNTTSVYNVLSETTNAFKERVEALGGYVESERCLDRELKKLGLENLIHKEITADFEERVLLLGGTVEAKDCLENDIFKLLHI